MRFFFASCLDQNTVCISNLLCVVCHMNLILVYLKILRVLSEEVCCYTLFCPVSSFLPFWVQALSLVPFLNIANIYFHPLMWEFKFSRPYQISHKAIVLCVWIGFLITLIASGKSEVPVLNSTWPCYWSATAVSVKANYETAWAAVQGLDWQTHANTEWLEMMCDDNLLVRSW